MIKTRQELIREYIEFFETKGHREIPSASLIPENDPTVLFTTAGMHPLVPFLLGEKHPLGKRLVDVQKCVRTVDIDEVGDEVHHTFFEMLGNWSLGDYFKKEAIEYSFGFLINILGLDEDKLAFSVFKGDNDAPKDEESVKTWISLGIPKERIAYLGKEDNWWGPAGEIGPCGPDTEMFYWTGKEKPPKKFNPDDKRWVEIWNDVFMEYNKTKIKAILVDAISCLIGKESGLDKELAELLKNTNKKIVVVTNADINYIKNKLENYNFDVFSLNKNPDKSNPGYFKKLLDKYQFKAGEVIYFDHMNENIKSAESFGIKSILYKNNNQIRKFIEDNESIYEMLNQKNVDTGMGVERTLAVLNGLDDNYLTLIFKPIISEIEKLSGKKYKGNEKAMRIIADHIRASVFILGDEKGIKPSNIGQGYVLRRLIRRAIRYGKILGIEENFTVKVAKSILPVYTDYSELERNKKFIFDSLEEEENRFRVTLEKGLRKFEEIVSEIKGKEVKGKDAFLLFQSYGFPIEMSVELAREKGIKVDVDGFNNEFKKHQELSRTTSTGVFKSGLADESEKTKRLHTATHLLNEALRYVLGKEVKQKGSNITPERLRFDFNFSRKLTNDEIKKVEKLVNQKIKERLEVVREEMSLQNAVKSGAQAEFGAKYPEIVSVYTVVDKKDRRGWSSKEICTGPHVSNTREIGKFRIIKEESVAAGIRRIKAVVE